MPTSREKLQQRVQEKIISEQQSTKRKAALDKIISTPRKKTRTKATLPPGKASFNLSTTPTTDKPTTDIKDINHVSASQYTVHQLKEQLPVIKVKLVADISSSELQYYDGNLSGIANENATVTVRLVASKSTKQSQKKTSAAAKKTRHHSHNIPILFYHLPWEELMEQLNRQGFIIYELKY